MSTTDEQTPAPPDNPATALFNILRVVILDQPQAAIAETWTIALDAALNSEDFVQRHAQTVSLFDSVKTIVYSNEDLKSRYSRHIPAWYNAVVYQGNWAENHGSKAINSEILHHLDSLGLNLKLMGVGGGRWDQETQNLLNDVVAKWTSVLNDADLPPEVARDLRRRLDELKWLTEQVLRFGVEPILDATSGLVAAGSRGAHNGSNGLLKKISAAVLISFRMLNTVHGAVDDVVWAVGVGGVMVHDMLEERPSSATTVVIAPANQGQLDNVVDAEIEETGES